MYYSTDCAGRAEEGTFANYDSYAGEPLYVRISHIPYIRKLHITLISTYVHIDMHRRTLRIKCERHCIELPVVSFLYVRTDIAPNRRSSNNNFFLAIGTYCTVECIIVHMIHTVHTLFRSRSEIAQPACRLFEQFNNTSSLLYIYKQQREYCYCLNF